MTERPTLSPFEQRIAAELERYVAGATDVRPAADVASEAMRPAGPLSRARRASGSRRLWILGLAAVLLIPAAAVGALVLRQPTPETVVTATQGDLAIFIRRDEGPEPGVVVIAARPDGGERVLRHVPDSILPAGSTLGDWGQVSGSGWLALGAVRQGGPWPMILVDLADPDSEPWVIDEANLGGIGARWGPTGLVAAQAADGPNWSDLVVVDPEARTTRHVSMQGDLIGGGPSIVWTADGKGFAGSSSSGYQMVPLDGSEPVAGVAEVYGRGRWGTGLSTLNIAGGGVDLVQTDTSAETIWRPRDGDRALDAAFAADGDGYWLAVDREQGSQVALIRLRDGRGTEVATINRDASWQDVGFWAETEDGSAVVMSVTPGAVIVPTGGAPQTIHQGMFAGFVSGTALVVPNVGFEPPAETMPAEGHAYALPAIDQLIAAELELNPGRKVLGSASRDGVPGDSAIRTFEVPRDLPGGGQVYLDCIGPQPVTVRSGRDATTSPCLSAGSYVMTIGASDPVIVEASGDTTWRVVIYSQ